MRLHLIVFQNFFCNSLFGEMSVKIWVEGLKLGFRSARDSFSHWSSMIVPRDFFLARCPDPRLRPKRSFGEFPCPRRDLEEAQIYFARNTLFVVFECLANLHHLDARSYIKCLHRRRGEKILGWSSISARKKPCFCLR